MEQKKTRYITTTLPYVNADPHIGFAYELLQADVLARYWRLLGSDVFFNTGTDEHGQKIAQKADEKGINRLEYVTHYAEEFKKLGTSLNLSYNAFIRTTDEKHIKAAQTIWQRCLDNGDIYKKSYKGLYCVGDEAFVKEGDLVNGKCPNHPTQDPVEIEEENYFFALSKYQTYLEDYLSQPGVVEPEWRRLEALKFVQSGLEDFSISREKHRLDWGIPVPDDDTQVMYVWFDALTNYISTLGWPEEEGDFKKYWQEGEVVQVAGKDQVRFQSIMWQAMLKSAGVKATDKVVYHGFINSDGQKMSKSLGNVISPYELVDRYGADATRYLLLRHIHPFEDSDITWEKLDEWYTADLVNGLGNLVARVMKMAETHLDKPADINKELKNSSFGTALNEYRFDYELGRIWSIISDVDNQIQEEKPFLVIKEDKEKAKAYITNYISQALLFIAKDLRPFMPDTAEAILQAITENKKPDNLFLRLEKKD